MAPDPIMRSTVRSRRPAAATADAATVLFTTVLFTIVSRNYIAQAATLMQSVRAVHPGLARLIILADEPWDLGQLDLAAELLTVDELSSPAIANMKWWYDVLEFNTAVKPYAFLHLFRRGFAQAIYLDPDILLLRPMDEVIEGLRHHSLVLTPHITAALPAEGQPTDHAIIKSGVWNCGFVALRNDDDGQLLARWWADRLLSQCRSDIDNNLFTDQRWIDLAPCFVAEVLRLRHAGYNVAYWNLPQRHLRLDGDGGWLVGDVPLVFFHFSGFAIGSPAQLSRYGTRHTTRADAALAALCDRYVQLVRGNGWERTRSAPYAFARGPDGRPVERPMRRWLLRAIDDGRLDPRQTLVMSAAFFDEPDETAAARGIVLTRLAYQLWLDRADLRGAFDLTVPSQAGAYREWLQSGEASRQGIAPRSIAAVADLASRPDPIADAMGDGVGDRVGDAVGCVADRPPPPWRPIADEAPAAGPDAAARFITGLVQARLPDGEVVLERQAALAWERRDDVARAFPLRTSAEARAYLTWAMTQGIAEGAIDPDLLDPAFIALLAAPSAANDLYDDVPVNALMTLTSMTAGARGRLLDFDRFPVERRGRLSHGLWFAFIAGKLYRWPATVTAAARTWFQRSSNLSCGAHPISRAVMAIWELRPDVREKFPLDAAAGRRAYLRWAAFQGLPEMGLTAAAVDPDLLAFLDAPSDSIDGVSEKVAAAFAIRTDLQASFDAADGIGAAALRRWGERYFRAEYDAALGLAGIAPPKPPVPIHRKLVLTGQWRVPSGRGEDVRGTAEALLAAGFTDFVVVDRDRGSIIDASGTSLPEATRLVVDTNIVHLNANTAYEDWRFLRRHGISADRTIGWWAWELERLPAAWRHAFAFVDEVWASTRFAREAFAAEGLRPVTMVPLAVAAPLTASTGRTRPMPPEGATSAGTRFLFAFDFRSYIARKNPEAVIAAFAEAFPTGRESASLLIKTQGAAQAPAAARRLRALATDARVRVWDSTLERDEMLRLIDACDAYVSLHRSEGFGRGPAEAMRLGKPVILTDYSGTMDFADSSCALPIRHSRRPVTAGSYPGGAGQYWAEPSVSDAARAMRWVAYNQEAARDLGRQARRRIEELYAPTIAGAAILRALGLPAHQTTQYAAAAAG